MTCHNTILPTTYVVQLRASKNDMYVCMYSSVIWGYGVLRAVIFFEKADESSPCDFCQLTISHIPDKVTHQTKATQLRTFLLLHSSKEIEIIQR